MSLGASISPTDLRDFAKSLGWTQLNEGLKDRLYVLQNPNIIRRQLIFPMDSVAPDYAESVRRILEKLGEILNESPEVLASRVRTVRDDTLRFRVFFDHGGDQSLSLSFAASLVAGTQQLLKAAACTVMRPRIHHPKLSLTEALQLVEKSRFGHTESGSFVLKISCPIQAMDFQGTLNRNESNEPFVRQVTLALRRGMQQLIEAIEADTLNNLVESLKEEATPLVSSNLCDALTQMYDDTLDNSLDVSFDWSASMAIPERDILSNPLRIQRDYFRRIEEVRRELRSVEGHAEDTFIGTVERLSGEMSGDGRRSGEVILALLLQEGETVRARVMLSADDYKLADGAHMQEGAYVKVTGKLQPGRQPRQLADVSGFQVIKPGTSMG